MCLDWKDAHWVCAPFFYFCFLASSQPPSTQCVPLPHSGYSFFSPYPLGLGDPTMCLSLGLIYSTNTEKWKLYCFFLLKMQIVSWRLLLYMQIMPYPHLLPSFPTERSQSEASYWKHRAELACRERPWGCNVKRKRLNHVLPVFC